MSDLLAEILDEKRKEVERLKNNGISLKNTGVQPLRDFKRAISKAGRINLITEIKFASPSAGIIRDTEEPVSIGRTYQEAGASAISLLTDRKFFGGELVHLPSLKKAVSLPILRKDFIIDEVQVMESFLWGADAILLIARVLSKRRLKDLLSACQEMGLHALTEVHDKQDLEKAIETGAEIIGINNRNLDNFDVDLRTTLGLAPLIPDGCLIVSESGIRDKVDIRRLSRTRIHAVLVGTALMKSDNMRNKIRELIGAGMR